MATCDYCGNDEMAYQLDSDHGPVVRCIPCLAVEQGQQQFRMPFEKFVDFDPGVVYDSEEDVRKSRKNSYQRNQGWWTVLARYREDEALLKRDPDAIGTVHDHIREFLTNVMGDDAFKPTSEVLGSRS